MRLVHLLGTATAIVALAGAITSPAEAFGGHYVFQGGTPQERTETTRALDASSFDWGLVPEVIVIHLARGVDSHALPGHIWIDTDLLHSGIFSWAVVQDEYAHQVDFLLFDDGIRADMNSALGGKAWCHGDAMGLRHGDYGCERFSSTLVWSYWPSKHNSYRPTKRGDESAAMRAPKFRALMSGLITQRFAFASTR